LSPKVLRTSGEVQSRRMGTLLSRMQGAQGPIPDPLQINEQLGNTARKMGERLPVATNTTRRNSGTIRKTPQVGMPRIHRWVGGSIICFEVQSPAFETTSEYPDFPGSGTVANPCHSIKGLSEIRVKVPGTGVTSQKFRYDDI
jgi:hypothetical protein